MKPRFFGQKFVIAAFILLVTAGALFFGKISEEYWSIISLGVLAGFGGLNLYAKKFRPAVGAPEGPEDLDEDLVGPEPAPAGPQPGSPGA